MNFGRVRRAASGDEDAVKTMQVLTRKIRVGQIVPIEIKRSGRWLPGAVLSARRRIRKGLTRQERDPPAVGLGTQDTDRVVLLALVGRACRARGGADPASGNF